MAKTSGFNVKKYRYYNPQTKAIDFDGLCQDIEVIYLVIVFIFMIEVFNKYRDCFLIATVSVF